MSVHLPIDELPGAIRARGVHAYLVTVREHRPHVVEVEVGWRGDRLAVVAGRHTAANVATHPEVTLLWPTTEVDPNHSLLVDGCGIMADDGEVLEIAPTAAVLHRRGGRRRSPRQRDDEG